MKGNYLVLNNQKNYKGFLFLFLNKSRLFNFKCSKELFIQILSILLLQILLIISNERKILNFKYNYLFKFY